VAPCLCSKLVAATTVHRRFMNKETSTYAEGMP